MQASVFFIGEVTDQLVQKSMQQISAAENDKEVTSIILFLNSKGGSVTASVALALYIEKHCKKNIEIQVLEYCGSTAMTILAAAKVRKAHNSSIFMTHSSGIEGLWATVDILHEAKFRYKRGLEDWVSYQMHHTNIPKNKWKSYYTTRKNYITAEQALNQGFITEII